MGQGTTRWFLSLQITLYLFLIFVQGNEDAEDAFTNSKSLVLEYFLPINLLAEMKEPSRREKRNVEGSGEDESAAFSELNENDDADNSTQNAVARLIFEKVGNLTTPEEGSGEIVNDNSEEQSSAVPLIDDSEVLTTSEHSENQTEETLTSTEMIFDVSEDFVAGKTEASATVATEPPTVRSPELDATVEDKEATAREETTTEKFTTEETSTIWTTETIIVPVVVRQNILEETIPSTTQKETTETVFQEVSTQTDQITTRHLIEEITTVAPIVVPQEVPTKTVIDTAPQWITTPKFIEPKVVPITAENFPTAEEAQTTLEPAIEEIFKETRMDEKLEASPGNILQKENLSLGADPLLIANTRLIDSEETVQLSSTEPKRLGAYIVIGLILLSFSSLVGYITFRKRMNRKRQEFESNQESNDTEKALLSLSDYKDSSELEENHLKNNEITPIVVKSNSQINKFEKNTNFSSPKNLNTIANEKNIEKDNVLKSTAENLTQVIIEDSPKEVEENVPSMEKLIVKTRIDQDSIPKKPIIINRSSAGYMPIPQDNSCVN